MIDFKVSKDSGQRPKTAEDADHVYDLIILGGGVSGLTAAIYAARARIDTLVIGGFLPGGQPANTDTVENFPGFPQGIEGPELAQRFQQQAERFGAKIEWDNITDVDFSSHPFVVKTYKSDHRAEAVIVATGAVPRRLGVPGEGEFFGRGVSTCATCDGFFYQDKTVVVVGGGDSAIVEGLYLTKFAKEVIFIHRRDELRAAKVLQERALEHQKARFVWDTVVEEILGDTTVSGVRARNVKTGEETTIEADGVFVYIGMEPQTDLFKGQLELDDVGYIVTDRHQRTNVEGVFAAGDVQDPDYRQLVIAGGTGAVAAIEAERWLEGIGA